MVKRGLVMLALVGLLAGCGGAAAHTVTDDQAQAKAKAMADYQHCQTVLEPFVSKLDALSSRLDVGLTQSEYNEALGDAKVAYDNEDSKLDGLSAGCRQARSLLAKGFDAYIAANTKWANCIQNSDWCTTTNSMLQPHWTMASVDILAAKADILGLKTPPKPKPTGKP